jgi:hypothetical protein
MDALLSLEHARDYLLNLPRQLEARLDDAAQMELSALLARFEEFFNIANRIDGRGDDQLVDAEEATEICDFGFMLLDKLLELTAQHRLSGMHLEIEQISLVLARWAIRHEASINDLRPLAHAVARLAESMRDRPALLALSALLTDIVEHCAPEFKQDQADEDELLAWHELHVARGKVAIRGRDPETIKRAFEEFLLYLPRAAPAFLAARMQEAEARDYPAPVRELVAYYLGHTPPALQ